ncbi:MAG: hypothetical protein AAF990_16725 [Bacteroidota bacterium]
MDGQTSNLRKLSEEGHVVIVTAFYPPIPGGTSVIIKNILKNIDPESYTVATISPSFSKASPAPNIAYLMNTFVWSSRLNGYWKEWHIGAAVQRLVRLCKAKKAKYIVGVYPDYAFLKIAYEAAKITGLPLISYLHDTVAEGLAHSKLADKAKELQDQVFQYSAHTFVMSEGMKDLYREKYNLEVDALEHTYPETSEEVHFDPRIKGSNIFWGGAIYSINQNAVKRVVRAATALETKVEIASKAKKAALEKMGLPTEYIELSFYNREAYLQALQKQQILLLALDWPDESKMHRDELATIFPTKTIEYLHAGRPILVHCPEDYFLARFIRQYNCGIVVTERSEEKLKAAIDQLKSSDAAVAEMVANAYKATSVFNHARLQDKFISVFKSSAQCVE